MYGTHNYITEVKWEHISCVCDVFRHCVSCARGLQVNFPSTTLTHTTTQSTVSSLHMSCARVHMCAMYNWRCRGTYARVTYMLNKEQVYQMLEWYFMCMRLCQLIKGTIYSIIYSQKLYTQPSVRGKGLRLSKWQVHTVHAPSNVPHPQPHNNLSSKLAMHVLVQVTVNRYMFNTSILVGLILGFVYI